MPNAWSKKRERQYEDIKKSETEQGRSLATAKRIAAATVNKTRSAKGETKAATRARKPAARGKAGARSKASSRAKPSAARRRPAAKKKKAPARKRAARK